MLQLQGFTTRREAAATRLRKGHQRSGKDGWKGRQSKEQEGVRNDGHERWQRKRLYIHNNPAALFQAHTEVLHQIRLHKANLDVAAYQEIWLQEEDNVVCTQMYDGEGREYQREWVQGVPLLVRRGLSIVQDQKVGARRKTAVYDKEGPYQDRPPLCPFRLSPLLTCS